MLNREPRPLSAEKITALTEIVARPEFCGLQLVTRDTSPVQVQGGQECLGYLDFDERGGEAEAAGADGGFERGNHFGVEARNGERANAIHREIKIHR
jgi:hypothetical protein